MATQSSSSPHGGEDRRDFLKSCGRFAMTVPPAMTLLLSTSLTSPAIAQSYGAGDERDERPISREPAAGFFGGFGQRGFLNLRMKRSVLPRIFGSNTLRL